MAYPKFLFRVIFQCLGVTVFLNAPVSMALAQSSERGYDAYKHSTVVAKLHDGRSISWICMGSGSPTVIMTAGAGDWSAAWRKVQPEIGKITHVCAWDRAGFGFSGPSPDVQDLLHTEADLEAALVAARIPGPYVLVGHSLGAYETLRFADRNPRMVAGLVLVDPAFPDQFRLLTKQYPGVFKIQSTINAQNIRDLRACIDGFRNGSIKPGGARWPDCIGDDPEYPVELRTHLSRLAGDPHRLMTELSFTRAEFHDAEQVVNPKRSYGHIPVIVLTATDTPDLPVSIAPKEVSAEMRAMQSHLWMTEHDHLAALSSKGENMPITGSMHYIQLIKPEVVIAAAIQVVSQARRHGSSKRKSPNRSH